MNAEVGTVVGGGGVIPQTIEADFAGVLVLGSKAKVRPNGVKSSSLESEVSDS